MDKTRIIIDRKKAVDELTRGRKLAADLQSMFLQTHTDFAAVPFEDIVEKILDSFDGCISVLSLNESDVVSRIPAVNSPSSDFRTSEDSGESCKTSRAKDRRGCYKRRRTSETWTNDTPNLIEDGHAWRKYGQKNILQAKYPRNYFRCTHKFDQLCQATKQVQKIQDDPPVYRTIYHGRHTCKSMFKPSDHIIIDDYLLKDNSSIIWSFKSNEPEFDDRPTNLIIKRETKEDVTSLNKIKSCSSEYLPNLTELENSGLLTAVSSGSDHGDVISPEMYSCTTSTDQSLDMDMMAELGDLLEVGYMNRLAS